MRVHPVLFLFAVLVGLSLAPRTWAPRTWAGDKADSLGQSIESFSLDDYRGHRLSLDELSDHEVVVVAFLGTQCPLAKFYGPRLQALCDEMAQDGVAFLGINSNSQDSLAEIAAYARRHKIQFPILKDLSNRAADIFGATRTPEVFVLDRHRVVRYQGRVDDTFTFGSGVGLAQPNETRADLKIAITELLAGKSVSVPRTPAKGCIIGRVREPSEQPTVTYANQISRIVQKHCVECHREGQIAPFTMDSYSELAGWGEMIAEVVAEQRMPPWHAGDKSTAKFLNEARLSELEKQQIFQWVAEGCPEGDLSQMAEPRVFQQGWFTPGGPDEVFYISQEPVTVKAEGVEDYRHYEVDPGFTEDKWVRVAECLPGNKSVVHHIIVFSRPPGGKPIAPGTTEGDIPDMQWIAGFAPGTRPLEVPEGWARLIPAGHTLVFQMHYTPIGTAQTDRSSVGLVYMDEKDVSRVVFTRSAMNNKFEIPPNAPNHEVKSGFEFPMDTELLALFPHMHLRGKSFRYELIPPGKNRHILLDVPRYDFNWQNNYILSEPLHIEKGSKLHCIAHFDNSEENLANPDSSKPIKWGPQSWDEMMIGFFDVGVSKEDARKLLSERKRPPEHGS